MRYIINPFTPIPKHAKSHVRGWSQHWADLLGAKVLHKDFSEIKSNDEVYIDHGVNFSGSLNLFGGVDQDLVERLLYLLGVKPTIYSLDIKMPDYATFLEKRIGLQSTTSRLTPKLCEMLRQIFGIAKPMFQSMLASDSIVIGDSHSTAFAAFREPVFRTNGKTLYSTLKNGIDYGSAKKVTLCVGSVDIRHHLARQQDPVKATKLLVREYIKFAKSIMADVSLCAPVPVEYAGRKIPKTGFYDGTPFYGTVDERRKLTSIFIEELRKFHDVILPPVTWYTMSPETYAREIMELSSSVHIAPQYYRARGNWNV